MGNSTKSKGVRKLSNVVSSVPISNRYLVIEDKVATANYLLPFTKGKYGYDRLNVVCHDGR